MKSEFKEFREFREFKEFSVVLNTISLNSLIKSHRLLTITNYSLLTTNY